MTQSEQRVHPRAIYFRLGTGAHTESYFSFRSAAHPEAIAALVLDYSEGGMQLLATADTDLTRQRFRLELHTAGANGIASIDAGEIQWVWSRPEGVYTRSGFASIQKSEAASQALGGLAAHTEHVIRCALYPLRDMVAA